MPHLHRRILAHVTYANLVSSAALLVALGTGTAYAANTISSADIIDGEVNHADLNGSAVAGDRVVDGSLTLRDHSGADVQTTMKVSKARPGTCLTSTVGVPGARPGQLVVLSPMGKPKKGVVLSATRVPANDLVEVGVCNVGAKTAKRSALRVRIVTFD
jgi:hypothetical protein